MEHFNFLPAISTAQVTLETARKAFACDVGSFLRRAGNLQGSQDESQKGLDRVREQE